MAWVGFGFGLGCVGFGLGLGLVSIVMDLLWLGLALVGFVLALDVSNSGLSFNLFETNLMHCSAPWMWGRQLQHQLRIF